MKSIVLATAVAAAFAAPVAAQSSSTAFAIQHFNMDVDSVIDQVSLPTGNNTQFVQTDDDSALATAFEIFNESADNVSDVHGLNGATVVSGTPSYGAEIFEALAAE